MAPVATTKLSSKGQVVIPEEVRNQLGLKAGDQFVAVGEGARLFLKPSFLLQSKISTPLLKKLESKPWQLG